MGGNTQKTLTPEEQRKQVKEQTRMLERSARKIDREIKKIQSQEAKQLKEVEKLAKKGQHGAAKIVAKNVAMCRAQTKNLYTM